MKKKIIVLSIFTILLSSLLLFGCSSTSTKNEPLKIVGKGYSTESYTDGSGQVNYAVEIENPNKDKAAVDFQVRITMKDANGNVIATEDRTMVCVYPESKYAVTNPKYVQSLPATVDFEILDQNGQFVSTDKLILPQPMKLESSNIIMKDGSYGTVSGEISNPNEEAPTGAKVVVVFYDDAGNVTSGTQTSSITIGTNGAKAPFSCSSSQAKQNYKVFVQQ